MESPRVRVNMEKNVVLVLSCEVIFIPSFELTTAFQDETEWHKHQSSS